MAATGQEMAYRCEQCGSSEIFALSLLYEQGTRSFSGRFTSGVSQSFTAKTASPPFPRNYGRACFGWGFAIFFCVFWGIAGFRGMLQHPQKVGSLEGAGLPASPFGLGAHFHVPPLRKVFSDPLVAPGSRSLCEFSSNSQ